MAVVFLLITVGRGGGDIESPLIRAGYRLALGGGQQGCSKGQACERKRAGMWPAGKHRGKTPDTGN